MAEGPQTGQTNKKSIQQSFNNKILIILSILAFGLIIYSLVNNTSRLLGKKEQKNRDAAKNSPEQMETNLNHQSQQNQGETTDTTNQNGQQKLPNNFPEDIPVIRDAQIISAISSEKGSAVTFLTEESLENIGNFYTTDLEKNGWKLERITEIENAMFYNITKNGRNGVIIINETDQGTQITIEVRLD